MKNTAEESKKTQEGTEAGLPAAEEGGEAGFPQAVYDLAAQVIRFIAEMDERFGSLGSDDA